MEKLYLKKELVSKEFSKDIKDSLVNYFIPQKESWEINPYYITEPRVYVPSGWEIPIAEIKYLIETAEMRGANFVSIDMGGEIGDKYHVYGLKIELAEEETLKQFLQKEQDNRKAFNKIEIARLEREIERLKKENNG